MDKLQTNQVRQVMMNELGLTRENIREMAETIIKETIVKQLKTMSFDKMIREVVKGWIKESAGTTVKYQIEKTAREQASELFGKFTISLDAKENPRAKPTESQGHE